MNICKWDSARRHLQYLVVRTDTLQFWQLTIWRLTLQVPKRTCLFISFCHRRCYRSVYERPRRDTTKWNCQLALWGRLGRSLRGLVDFRTTAAPDSVRLTRTQHGQAIHCIVVCACLKGKASFRLMHWNINKYTH